MGFVDIIDFYCWVCARYAGAYPQDVIKLMLYNPNAVDGVAN